LVNVSVVVANPKLAGSCGDVLSHSVSLEAIEQVARDNALDSLSLFRTERWRKFSAAVRSAFESHDYVIIKGLPAIGDGRMLLLIAQILGAEFRTYRGTQIVKHFAMSPWTTELSHTTKEGEFHTDLNTEINPPAITGMQCLDPDPGAPTYGVSRVARLKNLMTFLKQSGDDHTLKFLTERTVTMLNDHSSSSWSGHVVEGDIIRYHPETLRAAMRRQGRVETDVNVRIERIATAALAVSDAFVMNRGDILLLSNYRTLHYRGECSVQFKQFPTQFDSRSVFVLHMSAEREA
jgi:hypothetical protein